jgi:hypothetical protein
MSSFIQKLLLGLGTVSILSGGVYYGKEPAIATSMDVYQAAAAEVRYWNAYWWNECPHPR